MIPRHHEKESSPQVSSLLHTLRGEAFRRRRNLLGTRVHAPSSSTQGPSLPPLSVNHQDIENAIDEPRIAPTVPLNKVAGPSPPRSWIPASSSSMHPATPEWRSHALSLTMQYSPSPSPALAPPPNPHIPYLFQLCLRNISLRCGGIPLELFPHLPRHILREYVRYSVVHAPELLQREDLDALLDVDDAGSVDGEIIVSGRLADPILRRLSMSPPAIVSDWDSSADAAGRETPPALHTLVVIASSFSSSLSSLFPPTLTHLALISVPSMSLHKLPAQLPLIIFLDLSFNPWVAGRIVLVEWRKWVNLEVLGIRECGMTEGDMAAVVLKINLGRLKDVELIVSG